MSSESLTKLDRLKFTWVVMPAVAFLIVNLILDYFQFKELTNSVIAIEVIKGLVILSVVVFALRHLNRLEATRLRQQTRINNASRFAALGEVAAGMAHEINTPLGAITLSVSQLKELIPAEAERRDEILEIVDDVLSSAEKIARIIRGLKNISRESPGIADFVFCDLAKVIEEAAALCEPSLRHNEVKLIWGGTPEVLDIQCNPTQLSQVVINLVSNARDAAKDLPEKWVKVSARTKGSTVEIRVSDSGKGISPEVAAKLFQPFFTTKDVGSGTGLGLSVVHSIVMGHGGQVYLDESAKNTTFVVVLPKLQAGGRL